MAYKKAGLGQQVYHAAKGLSEMAAARSTGMARRTAKKIKSRQDVIDREVERSQGLRKKYK